MHDNDINILKSQSFTSNGGGGVGSGFRISDGICLITASHPTWSTTIMLDNIETISFTYKGEKLTISPEDLFKKCLPKVSKTFKGFRSCGK